MSSEITGREVSLKEQIESSLARTGLNADETSIELSMRRTGLSFQRTRMSADRTLMSVIRTSLSLISFGFTIFQFFRALRETGSAGQTAVDAARNFGLSLIIVGVAMLFLGLGFHLSFMKALRSERKMMVEKGLVHGLLPYPVSLTMIVALLLLVIGLVALISIVARTGPFV